MNVEGVYLYALNQLLPKPLRPFLSSWKASAGSYQKLYESLNTIAGEALDNKTRHKWQAQIAENKLGQLVESIHVSKSEVITLEQPSYPALLREITDPPMVLFTKGQMRNEAPSVAIVGSRRTTDYSLRVIPKICQPLVSSGVTIISGLAYGVDATVHQTVLNQQGHTWAVLGSGLAEQSIYPRANMKLAQAILAQGGALISEYPPLQTAQKHQFIARNRIIAGLSLGTVVVECARKSGALITADFSNDYNRSVYAVPGPITSPTSEGPNRLIQQGAMLVTTGADVLEDLGLALPSETADRSVSLNEEQRNVLKYIQSNVSELEDLCLSTNLSITNLNRIITELEMMQLIMRSGSRLMPIA